jgi:hypothetical protein
MITGNNIFELSPYIMISGIFVFVAFCIWESICIGKYSQYVDKQFPEIKMKTRRFCGFIPSLCYEDDEITDPVYLKLKNRIKKVVILNWLILLTTGIVVLTIFIFSGPKN